MSVTQSSAYNSEVMVAFDNPSNRSSTSIIVCLGFSSLVMRNYKCNNSGWKLHDKFSSKLQLCGILPYSGVYSQKYFWGPFTVYYCIAGNFRGRKLWVHGLVRSDHFVGKTFAECLKSIIGVYGMPQISWRKLSQVTLNPRNSWMFSPSKVFCYTAL